ncbi:MAG: NADH-ubiquinone oxidoreductase-F iron-sulfur binding region domain-containing protein [Verrucomicrobiales bacterium]|nr:NADH-ubiquinone oxidoreductase-F iron-sulfur binding region domain-containing protein [Verrucomicrobiales bacterium]
MSNPSDQDLTNRWKNEPAPLLPMLHAFHNRDGYLSEDSIRAVSEALKIPIAELWGTVTFYHHFSREQPGQSAPRVCTGNVCCLHGANELLESMKDQGATPMPCAGRCDDMIPVIIGDKALVGKTKDTLEHRTTPLPPPNPAGIDECVFSSIREPGRNTLDGYRKTGGYSALEKAVNNMTPESLIEVVTESKLAGRGGAGFPTGIKWKAVADAPGDPKTIVCNADEGEPGCFKDRAIMDHDPFAVIEGMTLAAFATGAPQGFIYLRYEYPETEKFLEDAIEDARAAGLLGNKILGTDFTFNLYVRRGAGAYICGEEGSLLNSLEGKHPFPRNKPPFPVTHGYMNKPTVVNNVETLASVPHIVEKGAEWYRNLGSGEHPGTKLISLSGDIKRPGNYEIPIGLPLSTLLYEWAGGPREGRTVQAVTMAGLSGGFIGGADLDATLDEPSLRSKGSFLGAGGIMVFDDSRDMVKAAHDAMAFFAHESCGKCFPCRIGTQRMTERLNGSSPALTEQEWKTEMEDIGSTMKSTSACGLGMAAPHVTESLMKYFPDQVEAHLAKENAS